MAISIKTKAATASTTVTKKKDKDVLTEETTSEAVALPETLQGDKGSTELTGAEEGSHAVTEMQQGATLLPPVSFCEVGFAASYTHNMGNYESCRLEVSIKIPCLHAEIDEAFNYGKEWVDARLSAINDELKAA